MAGRGVTSAVPRSNAPQQRPLEEWDGEGEAPRPVLTGAGLPSVLSD